MPVRNPTSPRLAGVLQVMLFAAAGALGSLLLSLGAGIIFALAAPTRTAGLALAVAVANAVLVAAPLLTWIALQRRQLSRLKQKFANAVANDNLTECLNATTFSGLVHAYSTGFEGSTPTGTLVLIDVDGFEALNERFGRRAGDQALRLVAAAARHSVRDGDLVGRIGDDSFAIFLPGASRENAEAIAERVRTAVVSIDFAPSGAKEALTVSGGAILFEGEVEFDILFRMADRQLQRTRSEGGNRIAFERLPPGGAAGPLTWH